MAESAIRVRVANELRNEFLKACRAQDQTASQVIRAFMRDYIDRYANTHHKELVNQQESGATSSD